MSSNSIVPFSPTAHALSVIGDRWSVLLLRALFLGAHRFSELAANTGASRATLIKRLRSLEAANIIHQKPYQLHPRRVEYRFTDKGRALYDFALAIWIWEFHQAQTQYSGLPKTLKHAHCGKAFRPVHACRYCKQPVEPRELSVSVGESYDQTPVINAGAIRRSSRQQAGKRHDENRFMLHFADVVADHWTPLVLEAAMIGKRRYDDIRRELGIATNILAHRLNLLIDTGMLYRTDKSDSAPGEYRLTDKGRDALIPGALLHCWARDWLCQNQATSMELHHCCNRSPLQIVSRCSECEGTLLPSDVSYT